MTADFQQAAIVASNQPAVDPATGVAYTQLPTTAAGASGTDYNDDGVSNGTIAFGATDASLMRNGFIYTVTGPNGQLYKTLALALNAFKKFDTTSNGDALIDSEPQLYIVNYAPDPVSESTSTSTSTSNSDSVSDSGSYSTSTSASDS
ncbi:hypothetical protein KII92_02410, partial [Leuconostoc gelidum subsp. gasicomitatum]|uniref:hypothetical protein n=2 Tax=Leuconostoc gasicomitatum TaxID=115778 RepID=UPI001CC77F2C